MASRLAKIPDHWLWLGLSLSILLAIPRISTGLTHLRTLTLIRDPPITDEIAQLPSNPTQQEDSISSSSLHVLALSPNIEIRQSATKILCQRFFASRALRTQLARDRKCDDAEVKHRAGLVVRLLRDFGLWEMENEGEGWTIYDASASAAIASLGERAMEGDREGNGEASIDMDARRRRREAVVIHQGGRPISQGDVFMRDVDGEGLEV